VLADSLRFQKPTNAKPETVVGNCAIHKRMEKLDENTIFDGYNRGLIIDWISQLKYFTFVRGNLNSYVTDGDEFQADFKYDGRHDLLSKLKSIGVEIKELKSEQPFFKFGQPVDDNNSLTLPEPLKNFPDLIQPKNIFINGYRIFIYILETRFWISISNSLGDREWWRISSKDIEVCRQIEKLIDVSILKPSRTYENENYSRYINRMNYPEYFQPE